MTPRHRHPGTHQTFQPCVEVGGVRLYPRQAFAEQAERLQASAIRIGVRIDREICFDGVVDGTDAGRKE